MSPHEVIAFVDERSTTSGPSAVSSDSSAIRHSTRLQPIQTHAAGQLAVVVVTAVPADGLRAGLAKAVSSVVTFTASVS